MNETSIRTLSPGNSIPYYYQIVSLLRRRIEAGELAPGSKLPKEVDLAKMFGVSRVPIRQALSLLQADGFISREHGRGTFVAKDLKKPQVVKLTGIIGWEVTIGTEHRLQSVDEAPLSSPLADFFGPSPSDRIIRFRRLRIMEGTPFSYIVNYLPKKVAERIKRAEFRTNTMLDILKNQLRVPLDRVQQTIQAIMADNEIAAQLMTEVMTPIMYVETFVRYKKGKPLLYSQTFYRGDRSEYSLEMATS